MSVQPVYNREVPDRTIPYITRDQYRAEPTGMDTQNLIRGSNNQADQDAELDRIILKASGWCDGAAEQPLTAQQSTETMRVPVTPDGRMFLHPRQWPIISVNSILFGPDPMYLSQLNDLSPVWVEKQQVIVPVTAALSAGWTGPLQFGTARPGSRVYVAMTYVAGYAVTTLRTAAVATDTTLNVADATGFMPGQQFKVAQGGAPTGQGSAQATLSTARPIVKAVDLVNNVLTLTAAIGTAFAAGAAVSTMPDEVEQAAILATTGMLKQRGTGALTMNGGNAKATVGKGDESPGAEEFDEAEAILSLYRPVM